MKEKILETIYLVKSISKKTSHKNIFSYIQKSIDLVVIEKNVSDMVTQKNH